MRQQDYRVAAYCRLSLDDENEGDSASIVTQKQMIERYVAQQGWTLVDTYVDDGWSGTNFDWRDFKRMLADIDCGPGACSFASDDEHIRLSSPADWHRYPFLRGVMMVRVGPDLKPHWATPNSAGVT